MSPRATQRPTKQGASNKPAGDPMDTPMMRQFRAAKEEATDCLLFFRMGDFYEMFFDDAKIASETLGLTLTQRQNGIPMAGVPVKSADGYLRRLVEAGHRVAICDQIQDPRDAKGIVDRAVVRIVTAGTITEEEILDAGRPNFLAALYPGDLQAGLAWVDLSTGDFRLAVVALEEVAAEMARIGAAELLVPEAAETVHPDLLAGLDQDSGPVTVRRTDLAFGAEHGKHTLCEHFGAATLDGFGVTPGDALGVAAAGALVDYLAETQKTSLPHVRALQVEDPGSMLVMDPATLRALEIVEPLREGGASLLEVLDRTTTAMGARRLRDWVLHPMTDVAAIQDRQAAVGAFAEDPGLASRIEDALAGSGDLERLGAKVATGRATPRDLVALADGLERVPAVRDLVAGSPLEAVATAAAELDPLGAVTARIRGTLSDEPPLAVKDGGLVRVGANPELDELLNIGRDGKATLAALEEREREATGISSLKVGFNNVFGYFLEVGRSSADRVPSNYVRKQTLKNTERFITPELKEFETKVLKADEMARELEYQIFVSLREEIAGQLDGILSTAAAVARVDAWAALGRTASSRGWCAPTVTDAHARLEIIQGRHPVLEVTLDGPFVPNDVVLDRDEGRLLVLTGPNMSGKSTYIRQTALITLLAQTGSWVPADSAVVGVADRILTRIGSSDEIARGQSTFMVEMVETARILHSATDRSLVVLDEVGRGTSTFDGLAIAWAICEELHETNRCRALFATHYHQLTDLAERLPGVRNVHVAVKEWGDEIVFLHRIEEGGTDRSWGIHVAKLAGVPATVTDRARQVLTDLEDDEEDLARRILDRSHATTAPAQPTLFGHPESPVLKRLRELDPDRLTPLQALALLADLKSDA